MIKHDDKTQANKLAIAAALQVVKKVGVKKSKRGEKKKPWRKRRIESDMTNLRWNINNWKGKGEERLEGIER